MTSDDPHTAGGTVYNDPLEELEMVDPDEYERVVDKLPKPRQDADGEYWPCLFYSTTNACKTASLDGLRTRKRCK